MPPTPADGRPGVTDPGLVALRDLRRTRQARRLGDTEWFDVAYRVYLFALVGLIAVVAASDAIEGLVDDDIMTTDLLTRGPSVAGVAAAVAVAIGLRNGAEGGPVSIESADVRHVLLAPIDRRRALLRPVVQRIRAVAFLPALSVAIVAQLVAREVEGSRAAWAASGALFGATLGVLYVGAALLAHELRCPVWLAGLLATGIVAGQVTAAWTVWQRADDGLDDRSITGPAGLLGGTLFWGIRQRADEAIAVAAVIAVVTIGCLLAGRLRLDPLERRGQLVSQLRFAATVQDIRTVVLLRRQLRAESARTRPWFRFVSAPVQDSLANARRPDHRPRRRAAPVAPAALRRGVVAVTRIPAARVLRMGALAVVGGVCASLVVTSSWLFAIGLVGAAFLLGLEAIEPLAQEVDRPDLTESLAVDRGHLFVAHLMAPAGVLVVAGLVGAGAATAVEPRQAAAAFALALPVAFGGAIGPVVSTVRDAPEPAAFAATTLTGRDRNAESPFSLPEFAGASNIMTGLAPIVFSSVALAPVAAMRADATVATAVRSVIGVALCLVVLTIWMRRRDRWARRLRDLFAEGRAAT